MSWGRAVTLSNKSECVDLKAPLAVDTYSQWTTGIRRSWISIPACRCRMRIKKVKICLRLGGEEASSDLKSDSVFSQATETDEATYASSKANGVMM